LLASAAGQAMRNAAAGQDGLRWSDRTEEKTVTAELDTTLRQRVIESMGTVLPRLLEREIPAVAESMLLMEELGLRSTAIIELLVELEETLDIQIDVEDIDRDDVNSVGELADFVASHALADG
jgi:acyl carrier protein